VIDFYRDQTPKLSPLRRRVANLGSNEYKRHLRPPAGKPSSGTNTIATASTNFERQQDADQLMRSYTYSYLPDAKEIAGSSYKNK
jgi:hypothetical protein